MSIVGLQALEAVQQLLPDTPSRQSGAIANANFGERVTQGLQQVNQQLLSAQQGLQALAVGEVQNLHQLMITLEESQMAFQLAMQVRNRALESYQELMRMSV